MPETKPLSEKSRRLRPISRINLTCDPPTPIRAYDPQIQPTRTMGGAASKPEDILKVVDQPVNYQPPLEVNGDNTMVYFDLQLGRYGDATKLGRVVMELKDDVTPKTAENFKQLCMAGEGAGYKGSRFHRVIPSFM